MRCLSVIVLRFKSHQACRSVRLPVYQTAGLSDCRSIRLPVHQIAGPSDCRQVKTKLNQDELQDECQASIWEARNAAVYEVSFSSVIPRLVSGDLPSMHTQPIISPEHIIGLIVSTGVSSPSTILQ